MTAASIFCVTNNVLALPQGADLKNICTQVATDFVSKDSGVCDSDLAKVCLLMKKAMCKSASSREILQSVMRSRQIARRVIARIGRICSCRGRRSEG